MDGNAIGHWPGRNIMREFRKYRRWLRVTSGNQTDQIDFFRRHIFWLNYFARLICITKAFGQVPLTTTFQTRLIGWNEIAFWQQKHVFKLVCMPNLRPMTFATETHGQHSGSRASWSIWPIFTRILSPIVARCQLTRCVAGMLQSHCIEFWFLGGDNFRMNHVMQF